MDRRTLLLAPLAWPALAAGQAPLRVVASFSILADLVREVGGDAVHVSALVGPDADAHVYEPTPAAVQRLSKADLVVTSGLGFEGWMQRLIPVSGFRGPVIVASDGITPRRMGLTLDPHAWQDLSHARRYVANLRDALARVAPGRADFWSQRAARYDAELAATDDRVRRRLDALPRGRRRAITSHDAFGYFGGAYGVDFLPLQGMSTHSEPSAAAMARLIEQIRRERIRAVFAENISDPRLVERIAAEGGARLGGRLYSDALSAPGGPADTYLRLFVHNAEQIAAALGG